MSTQKIGGVGAAVQFSPRGFPSKNNFSLANQPLNLRPEMGKTGEMFSFKKT